MPFKLHQRLTLNRHSLDFIYGINHIFEARHLGLLELGRHEQARTRQLIQLLIVEARRIASRQEHKPIKNGSCGEHRVDAVFHMHLQVYYEFYAFCSLLLRYNWTSLIYIIIDAGGFLLYPQGHIIMLQVLKVGGVESIALAAAIALTLRTLVDRFLAQLAGIDLVQNDRAVALHHHIRVTR